jgi:ferredoxin-NADP reductase
MIAIKLESPPEFEAEPGQFVLVEAPIDGETETGYYTLSSPVVGETFEITAKYDSSGTVGPWLADRDLDDEIEIKGPFGDIQYTGGHNVIVMASGPGIGPAVGITERARNTDSAATIIYQTKTPAYEDRLEKLELREAEIHIVSDSDDLTDRLQVTDSNATVYVFGFSAFISAARDALKAAAIDSGSVYFENFGPE